MKSFMYKKTKTVHFERKGWEGQTMCAIRMDEENWTTNLDERKKTCKRCRVASGSPARHVYRYGPMAWRRRR